VVHTAASVCEANGKEVCVINGWPSSSGRPLGEERVAARPQPLVGAILRLKPLTHGRMVIGPVPRAAIGLGNLAIHDVMLERSLA
jgi:hypothetical protein